jgi:hypothetical protein
MAKNSEARPDDHRPGRLPAMMSSGGNLIWSCRVYAQPGVRLVLRASTDGNVFASIGGKTPPSKRLRGDARPR